VPPAAALAVERARPFNSPHVGEFDLFRRFAPALCPRAFSIVAFYSGARSTLIISPKKGSLSLSLSLFFSPFLLLSSNPRTEGEDTSRLARIFSPRPISLRKPELSKRSLLRASRAEAVKRAVRARRGRAIPRTKIALPENDLIRFYFSSRPPPPTSPPSSAWAGRLSGATQSPSITSAPKARRTVPEFTHRGFGRFSSSFSLSLGAPTPLDKEKKKTREKDRERERERERERQHLHTRSATVSRVFPINYICQVAPRVGALGGGGRECVHARGHRGGMQIYAKWEYVFESWLVSGERGERERKRFWVILEIHMFLSI